jgi:phosphohistidine phosphatase
VRLYLMRHGDASAAPPGGSDGDRPLTAKGRSETREIAAAFASRIQTVGAIYTSPLVRAVQTGEVFAQALRFEGIVGVLVQLASGCAPEVFFRSIPRTTEDVILIGHLPSIQDYAGWLVGKNAPVFGKSALLGVEVSGDRPPGRFMWMLTPGSTPLASLP